jgi:hypothetical protein
VFKEASQSRTSAKENIQDNLLSVYALEELGQYHAFENDVDCCL